MRDGPWRRMNRCHWRSYHWSLHQSGGLRLLSNLAARPIHSRTDRSRYGPVRALDVHAHKIVDGASKASIRRAQHRSHGCAGGRRTRRGTRLINDHPTQGGNTLMSALSRFARASAIAARTPLAVLAAVVALFAGATAKPSGSTTA